MTTHHRTAVVLLLLSACATPPAATIDDVAPNRVFRARCADVLPLVAEAFVDLEVRLLDPCDRAPIGFLPNGNGVRVQLVQAAATCRLRVTGLGQPTHSEWPPPGVKRVPGPRPVYSSGGGVFVYDIDEDTLRTADALFAWMERRLADKLIAASPPSTPCMRSDSKAVDVERRSRTARSQAP